MKTRQSSGRIITFFMAYFLILHHCTFQVHGNSCLCHLKIAENSAILNVQRCKNAAYFATDHVYDCKHANVTGRKTFEQNLQTIRYIFNHEAFISQIRQPFIENHALHFGAPIMERHFPNLVSQIQDLPYNIQYIYFRYNKRPDNETVQFVKYFKPNKNKVADNNTQATATGPTTGQPMGKLTDAISNATKPNAYINNNVKRLSHAVFKAYPLPRQDCYKLFALTANAEEQYVDLAYIPNYKTSIMMNTLLRNVKENTNMDALEESDDEEEFENPEEDELLNLAKSIHILCEYSPKFKKWVPMSKSEQAAHFDDRVGHVNIKKVKGKSFFVNNKVIITSLFNKVNPFRNNLFRVVSCRQFFRGH